MIHGIAREVIGKLGITKFVETGTFVGETVVIVSEWFSDLDPDFGEVIVRETVEDLAKFFPRRRISYPSFRNAKASCKTKLLSIDLDTEKQRILGRVFGSNPNIFFVNGSSVSYLKMAIDEKTISDEDKVLFYLDAHWGKYWPLRDEIKQVLRLKKAVIMVDDFVVPGHPTYGFDAYNWTDRCAYRLWSQAVSGGRRLETI